MLKDLVKANRSLALMKCRSKTSLCGISSMLKFYNRIKPLLAACKPLILLDFHKSYNYTPTTFAALAVQTLQGRDALRRCFHFEQEREVHLYFKTLMVQILRHSN